LRRGPDRRPAPSRRARIARPARPAGPSPAARRRTRREASPGRTARPDPARGGRPGPGGPRLHQPRDRQHAGDQRQDRRRPRLPHPAQARRPQPPRSRRHRPPPHPGARAMTYDRWFLLGEKRNELLARWEVEQYGRDNFGDPDYISLYGLAPREWYARGVRILGRTAVECTRDRLADRIGRDVAAVTRAACAASPLAIDLFAGSANTLHWMARHAGARQAIAFELDDAVFSLTRANLSAMGLDIDLRHDSYEHGLTALGDP